MKNVLVVLIAVFSFNLVSAQTQVGAVTLPNTVNFGGQELALNGAGIRKKAMILKLYSGGLYLATPSSNANSVINSSDYMAIKLHITSGFVSSDAMKDAVEDGFDASMDGDTASLSSEITKFVSFFNDEIVEDNIFDITYQGNRGVVVYKNGTEVGSIRGLNFKKALFGIWLGDDPADKKLKNAMLNK
ncbi:MAG: chalcone isomerase family protein [Flavobacteriaceae bacterium]|nr:chalcone isomerase family protein [Flavobacteriaceae bacterium]